MECSAELVETNYKYKIITDSEHNNTASDIPIPPILTNCTKNPAMLYNAKVSKGGKSATAPRHSGTNNAFSLCIVNKKRGYFTPL